MFEVYTPENWKMIRRYQEQLLADAARDRLLCQIGANRSQWRRRIQMGIGSLLIAMGKKLQEPYQIAIAREAKAY